MDVITKDKKKAESAVEVDMRDGGNQLMSTGLPTLNTEMSAKRNRGKTVIMPSTSMDDFYDKAPACNGFVDKEDLEFEKDDFNLRDTPFFDINDLTADRWQY